MGVGSNLSGRSSPGVEETFSVFFERLSAEPINDDSRSWTMTKYLELLPILLWYLPLLSSQPA